VEPGRERVNRADRAAVRDNEHLLARVLPEDVGEKVLDPGRECLEGLGVLRAGTIAVPPKPMSLAEALLDLRRRQTFPGAEPALAQARIESHLEVEILRQDLRGLACPVQVAGINGVDGAVEGAGERSRLFAAEVVEARVRQALPAPFAVPVGLPVPNK